tara:strand:+ start:411 stop:2981 length:2571 start_codon:yes stop_codon:yes gene_type:complete
MSQINLKSITGITSITTPGGVDDVFTVHSNDTTERFRVDSNGNQVIAGILTVTQDLNVDGHINLDNVSIAGIVTVTGELSVTDDIIAGDEIRNNVATDFWASDNTFINLNGFGNLTHMGGYETNLTSNGYRDTNGQWVGYSAGSNGGAAQIGLKPQGSIVFRTDATKANGSAHNPSTRLTIDDEGVRPQGGVLNLKNSGSTGNITANLLGVSGDSRIDLENTGDGNYSGIDFVRERSSGTGVVGGSIFMKSDTSTNNALLYIQAQSASAQSPVTTALSDNNGVRLKLQGGQGIFAVETGASERLRITADGKVTLGTTTPSSNSAAYMFTVADPTNSLGNCGITIRAGTGGGSNTNQGSIFYSNATSGTGEYAGYLQYNHNDNWFRIGTNSGERFRITSDGKIGINDDAPERTMDVKGSNCMIQLEGTAGSGRQWSLCSTDNATGTAVDGGPSGSFAIYDDTSGNARLRIDSGGNARFLVSGGSFTAEGTGAYGMSIHNHNSPSMGHLFIFGDNGLIRFRNSSSVYTCQMGYTESNNTMFFANQEGGTTMYITDDGVKLFDNNKFLCGNDQDLEIYHNNSNAFIKNGTGQLLYRSGQHVFENAAGSVETLRIKTDGRVSINDGSPSSAETLTIRPLGNVACDVSLKINHSTDSRVKFYDSGGTNRGGFGFTEYANSTDYPNFHDSFYFLTDPSSNGSLTAAMRINNAGCFMYPKQPCFSVAMSSNYSSGTSHTANFNVERFDQGDNFNTGSNGIFTAPVTGKYYMHAAIQTQAGGTASQVHLMGVGFTVNGSIQESKGSGDQYLGRDTGHYITVHAIRILNLAQGDTVQVYILLHGTVAIEGQGGIDRCNWQGYLMA